MRLLIVLNESPAGSHDDVHRALAGLVKRGKLESYSVYPFSARLDEGVPHERVSAEIVATAQQTLPSAILWSHTGGLRVDDDTLSDLRQLRSRPVMGYWDNDMYHALYKPFPRAAREIALRCDVVFVCGYSGFVESLRRSGCEDIRYTPSPTDEDRFASHFILNGPRTPEFDVVMVANRVTSRFPGKTMPGARERTRLVKMLRRRLGSRFAVFGHGWHGACAQGPIPLREQASVLASGRVTVGNNNLHAAYYFSNRLPIAMSCGAMLIHNWERGFDGLFGPNPPVRFFRTTDEAWARVRDLLGMEDGILEVERARAHALALTRFTMSHVQEYIVTVLSDLKDSTPASGRGGTPQNPWLGNERL